MKSELRDRLWSALTKAGTANSGVLPGSKNAVLPLQTPGVTTLPLLPRKNGGGGVFDISCSTPSQLPPSGEGNLGSERRRLPSYLFNKKSLQNSGSSGNVVTARVSGGSSGGLLPQAARVAAPGDEFSPICIRRLVALFRQSPVPLSLASSEEEMRSAFHIYSGSDCHDTADIPVSFVEAWRASEALWFNDIRDQAQAHDRLPFIGMCWEGIHSCLVGEWRLDPQVALELAHLLTRRSYKDFTEPSWLSSQDAARQFVLHWAPTAVELGWHYDDLFGLDRRAPAGRIDRRGLAWCLGTRRRVIAMDPDGADLLSSGGVKQRFFRSARNHCA